MSDWQRNFRVHQVGIAKKRKPNFELMLRELPSITELSSRINAEPSVGPLGVLEGLCSRLEKIKATGEHDVVFENRTGEYAMEPRILARYVAFEFYGRKIYKMGREFSAALNKVDLDIPCIHLPIANKIICIEFPDNLRFNLGPASVQKFASMGNNEINLCEDRYAHCVYLFTTDQRVEAKEGLCKRYLELCMPLYDPQGRLTTEVQEYGIPIYDLHETFMQAVERASKYNTVPHDNIDFLKFVLKSLVYIYSGDPDLRQYVAPKNVKNKNERRWNRETKNQSLLDMTLVGFSHMKKYMRHADSSTRCGHYRWQPYGPQKSKVKLIWIDEYTVHYKKEVK